MYIELAPYTSHPTSDSVAEHRTQLQKLVMLHRTRSLRSSSYIGLSWRNFSSYIGRTTRNFCSSYIGRTTRNFSSYIGRTTIQNT